MGGSSPRPVADRFWEKVARAGDDECWLWTGKRNNKGYGRLQIGSRTDGSRRFVMASRLSYEINSGPAPSNLDVCHSCDNPPCVNPKHLFLGTRKVNMQDAVAKGRMRQPDPLRTHCRYGHELTPDNTRVRGHLRLCRHCERDARLRWYAKNAPKDRARARAKYWSAPEAHRTQALKRYHDRRK